MDVAFSQGRLGWLDPADDRPTMWRPISYYWLCWNLKTTLEGHRYTPRISHSSSHMVIHHFTEVLSPIFAHLASALLCCSPMITLYRLSCFFRWIHLPRQHFPHYNRKYGYCQLCRILHGINIDDVYSPSFNANHHRPLLSRKVSPRTIPRFQELVDSNESEECFWSNDEFRNASADSLASRAFAVTWYYARSSVSKPHNLCTIVWVRFLRIDRYTSRSSDVVSFSAAVRKLFQLLLFLV